MGRRHDLHPIGVMAGRERWCHSSWATRWRLRRPGNRTWRRRWFRMIGSIKVDSVAGLMEALQSGVEEIEVQGTLSGMPMITLARGVRLRGGTLKFGAKG